MNTSPNPSTFAFDDCFTLLIGHEGGYVNHPQDPGGETKFGITKRSYPNLDIKSLTLEQAKAIYRRDFWDRLMCDELPAALRFQVFDAAVNSGAGNAARWLQAAAKVPVDGDMGPRTRMALRQLDAATLCMRFNGVRLGFMASLSTWSSFGKGWARRIATNLQLM